MAVSKRVRFEVLRRDTYTCRYCRSKDNELTVDHVTPVALGGTDDPSNLVACCKDCNAGKSSTSPDAHTVAQVADDALRWRAAMRQAMDEFNAETDASLQRFEWFTTLWCRWDASKTYLPPHWLEVLTEWTALGVREDDIRSAYSIAMRNESVAPEATFNYMRGVVRNRMEKVAARAQEILEANDGA